MNVVLTGSGRYVEIQGTSERRPFGDEQAQALLGLARAGAAKLFEAQRAVLALELGA
jgi:ribonuclease PH